MSSRFDALIGWIFRALDRIQLFFASNESLQISSSTRTVVNEEHLRTVEDAYENYTKQALEYFLMQAAQRHDLRIRQQEELSPIGDSVPPRPLLEYNRTDDMILYSEKLPALRHFVEQHSINALNASPPSLENAITELLHEKNTESGVKWIMHTALSSEAEWPADDKLLEDAIVRQLEAQSQQFGKDAVIAFSRTLTPTK